MRLNVDRVTMQVGARTLFRELTLGVDSGETLAVLGPSGSGKSTLLGGIAGLIPVESGRVWFDSPASKPSLHWLFQSTPLLMRRNAADNIALVAELKGSSRTESLEVARQLLSDLGLSQRAKDASYRLSGGEKQRVAVARAYVSGADVILADEPTASLDPESREHVTAMLMRSAERGAIVAVATHDPWVAAHCKRVLRLPEGADVA
jgi:ABC-type lipoprotein export system ATPase subunit